jgi:hypothetical protein
METKKTSQKKTALGEALREHLPGWPRPSPIHGVGLFALRRICQGERLFQGRHECRWFPLEELRRLPAWAHGWVVRRFMSDRPDFGMVPVPVSLLEGRIELAVLLQVFINASKTPNVKHVAEGGETWCVALRDIEAGEEITADYPTWEEEKKLQRDQKIP